MLRDIQVYYESGCSCDIAQFLIYNMFFLNTCDGQVTTV